LTNDSLIYAKHVKPIFEETLSNTTSFVNSWNDYYDNIEKFKNNTLIIQTKLKKLSKVFQVNQSIH